MVNSLNRKVQKLRKREMWHVIQKLLTYLTAPVLALTLAMICFAIVFAEEIPSEDIVSTEEELDEWCYEHDGTGGTVYLGCDITVEYGVYGGYGGGHIVIDTGEFGLIYNGAGILLNDYEIVGEGFLRPVVTMIDAGWRWMGNWNNDLILAPITALGRDGAGGNIIPDASVDGETTAGAAGEADETSGDIITDRSANETAGAAIQPQSVTAAATGSLLNQVFIAETRSSGSVATVESSLSSAIPSDSSLQEPESQPFAPVRGSISALAVAGAAALCCFSALVWIKIRRSAKVKP